MKNPQLVWEQLLGAYAAGNWDLIEASAAELLQHLDQGGTPPNVLNRPGLGPDWDRALTQAACFLALDTVQGHWATISA